MEKNNVKEKLLYLKLILVGILVFIIFYWVNCLIFAPVVSSFYPNNLYMTAEQSYLIPIHSSIIGLATLCIICVIIIVRKVNELIAKIDCLENRHD